MTWQLAPDSIHIWQAWIPDHRRHLETCIGWLSAAEQARMARLRFPADRATFAIARGLLRRSLSRYLGQAPADVHLMTSAYGKPCLPDTNLHFNLSHAGHMVIYAIARHEIGIDIERVCAMPACLRLAERFFTPAEAASLRGLPVEAQVRAFFWIWTQKEAYLKGRGTGLLDIEMHQFTVSTAQTAGLQATPLSPLDTQRWRLIPIHPGKPDYLAMLATTERPVTLTFWEESS